MQRVLRNAVFVATDIPQSGIHLTSVTHTSIYINQLRGNAFITHESDRNAKCVCFSLSFFFFFFTHHTPNCTLFNTVAKYILPLKAPLNVHIVVQKMCNYIKQILNIFVLFLAFFFIKIPVALYKIYRFNNNPRLCHLIGFTFNGIG